MSKTSKTRTRRNFNPSEKVKIVKEHLLEKVPVSELCEREDIKPNQFYDWQKKLFSNGERAFEAENRRKEKKLEDELLKKTEELQHKDSVIGEIMSDFVALKKKLSES
mgnify:CR=1 FL=1